MCFTVWIDVPLSFKAFRLSLLIIIFYVQNQPTASQWSSQRGAALLSVSQNRSYRCGKRTRRAKASVKITRPFQPPRPWHPLPPPPSTRTSPSHTLCPLLASTCFYLRSVHFAVRTAAVYRRSTQRDRA